MTDQTDLPGDCPQCHTNSWILDFGNRVDSCVNCGYKCNSEIDDDGEDLEDLEEYLLAK